MILRDGYEYEVRRGLDALLNTHQDIYRQNGKLCKSYPLAGQVFPCHDSMLRVSSWPAWLAFCSFLLTWVIYKCRTGELKAPAQLGWAGKRYDSAQDNTDDLCPMKTPKVIEETFLRTMKQVWIWNTTGRTELIILYCAILFLQILCMEVTNTRHLGRQTFKKRYVPFQKNYIYILGRPSLNIEQLMHVGYLKIGVLAKIIFPEISPNLKIEKNHLLSAINIAVAIKAPKRG